MRPQEIAEAIAKLVERLRLRKGGYQLSFSPVAMADLARFCRANETTFHPTQSARTQAMLEGRRQVWLRIEQHLNLNPEQLAALYRAAVLDQGDSNG